MRIALPYGRTPLAVELADRDVEIAEPARVPGPVPELDALLDAELARVSLPAARRVTVAVSDATRVEPRGAFLDAIRRRLGDGVDWTIAIATGTHGPARLDELGLPAWTRDATIVNHDGHGADDLVDLGETARGTPVRLHRCAVDADLVVATGCIRPHYFAGFGAGVKAIFPGLGEAAAVRVNHRWKTALGARAGIVVGNPCREDLEEAVARVPAAKLLVNGVCDPDGAIRAVVAGDIVADFRRGVAIARPWFEVAASPAPIVIASDRVPVSASLYQAAKIAAGAAPFVEPGGLLVVAAECFEGIEPLAVVNEAIWRIGVLARLPAGVELRLVSGLDAATLARTLVTGAESVEAAIEGRPGHVLILPRASVTICRT